MCALPEEVDFPLLSGIHINTMHSESTLLFGQDPKDPIFQVSVLFSALKDKKKKKIRTFSHQVRSPRFYWDRNATSVQRGEMSATLSRGDTTEH